MFWQGHTTSACQQGRLAQKPPTPGGTPSQRNHVHDPGTLSVRVTFTASTTREKQITVMAEIADPDKKRALWTQLVASLPFYEKYQQKTTREIPMVILHPVDEQITS